MYIHIYIYVRSVDAEFFKSGITNRLHSVDSDAAGVTAWPASEERVKRSFNSLASAA